VSLWQQKAKLVVRGKDNGEGVVMVAGVVEVMEVEG